jgi:hypothetical protein
MESLTAFGLFAVTVCSFATPSRNAVRGSYLPSPFHNCSVRSTIFFKGWPFGIVEAREIDGCSRALAADIDRDRSVWADRHYDKTSKLGPQSNANYFGISFREISY